MVITLSRQTDAGGEQIASLLCERGGLRLADREVLERVAQSSGLSIAQVTLFDGVMPGPAESLVSEWRASVSYAIYLRRLVQTLLLLEREDNVLIVGRGAAFVLTDPGTLHARVVAPMPCRIARLTERTGIHAVQARRALEASDAARARFVLRSFDADIADPMHYDLTVSTAEMPAEEAADIVLEAAARKARRRSAPHEAPSDLLTSVTRLQRRPRLPRVSGITWRYLERRLSSG